MRKLILSGVISLGLILSGCTSTNTNEKVENDKPTEQTQEVKNKVFKFTDIDLTPVTNDTFNYKTYKGDLEIVLMNSIRNDLEMGATNLDHLKISDERIKYLKKDYEKNIKALKEVQKKYKDVNKKEVKEEKELFDLYIKNYEIKSTQFITAVENKTELPDNHFDISDDFYYFTEKLAERLGLE